MSVNLFFNFFLDVYSDFILLWSIMPFLTGPGPTRRSLQYLKHGTLIFRERVKIMEIHYNMYFRMHATHHIIKYGNPHIGLRDFYFWFIPQIQYKNPEVQIVRFLEMTPTPFIRCWLDDGRDILFDCDSQSKETILERLKKVLGKTKRRIELENRLSLKEEDRNPACFGFNQKRFCICEIPGQVPCSGTCHLPKKYVGLYKQYKKQELEDFEKDLDAALPTQKEIAQKFKWSPNVYKPVLGYIKNIDRVEYTKPPHGQIFPLSYLDGCKEDQEKP